jgi:signal peptidase
MLVGNSMKGTIDSGTFIVIKPEQEYFLGDIIAFENEQNRKVIHRIIEITDEGFITKGDNNKRIDPGIQTLDKVLGRSMIVVPFVGFTSMFIQTPLGMSIFGVWALVMFMIKKPEKIKKVTRESFTIFKVGLISVIANYIITQSALGMNIYLSDSMNIPFSNILEPNTANTITFGILLITIIGLYYFVRIQDKKTNDVKVVKLILSLGVILIMIFQIISILGISHLWINEINKIGIIPIF